MLLRDSLSNPGRPLLEVAEACLTGAKPQVSGGMERAEPAAQAQVGPTQMDERIAVELQKVDHKLQPEEIRKLVVAYQSGATIRSLGRRFSVHEQTVRAHVRRAGVVLRPLHALDEAQAAVAVQLHDSGMSKRAISRKLGVGPTAVEGALRRARRFRIF